MLFSFLYVNTMVDAIFLSFSKLWGIFYKSNILFYSYFFKDSYTQNHKKHHNQNQTFVTIMLTGASSIKKKIKKITRHHEYYDLG